MAETSNRNEEKKECTDSCNSEFIDCVESWRQDCLVEFKSCASSCEI